MQHRLFFVLLCTTFVSVSACKTRTSDASKSTAISTDPNVVSFTVLQINDVYEINPVVSGSQGGLARVATLKKTLLAENPNLITVLPGDFLSPSAMGATAVDGEPLAGKQMVATLNAVGIDYVSFGNHEFDLTEARLLARMNESHFKWIGSNVRTSTNTMIARSVSDVVVPFHNSAGAEVKVGLFGICINTTEKSYVQFLPTIETARHEVSALTPQSNVIIAMTHLSISEDKALAAQVPAIDVVLGGHEHVHTAEESGDDHTPIFKADANARTAYVHRMTYDISTKKFLIDSTLVDMDASVPLDDSVKAVAQQWTDSVFTALRASGTDPERILGVTNETLEGFEATVRSQPTTLTNLVGESFFAAEPTADAVVYGAGSIRIDDRILPGPVTQYDVLRIFPFGGKLILADMLGRVVTRMLDQGVLNAGTGGYLQTVKVTRDQASNSWFMSGAPIVNEHHYRILVNEYLLTGLERGLEFLGPTSTVDPVVAIRDSAMVQTALATWLGRTIPTFKIRP